MKIRPATVNDARALAEVHVAAWRTAYAGLLPQTLLDGLDVERRTAQWESLFVPDGPVILLAEDAQQRLGHVSFGPSRDADADAARVGEIWSVYVVPTRWGQGIGTSLCQAALEALRQRGCTEATLWVLDANYPARRFYKGLGFTADGGVKSCEMASETVHEVRYRKSLHLTGSDA